MQTCSGVVQHVVQGLLLLQTNKDKKKPLLIIIYDGSTWNDNFITETKCQSFCRKHTKIKLKKDRCDPAVMDVEYKST